MKISAFSVVMVSMLLVTASAQAFPFGGKKDDTASATAATTETNGVKSSAGYQSERFRTMDKNHDGKISEEEFLADPRAEFSRLDQDKDKSISADELDLPAGLNAQQKDRMRKLMQDRETMMKQRQAEQEKRMQENMKRMQAEREAEYKRAAAAAAPTQATEAAPAIKTEEAKKEKTQKPATTIVPAATAKAVAFTSSAASAAVTAAPAFSSGAAAKAVIYTSSSAAAPHVTTPVAPLHGTVPAVKH
jgi:hypothetical protein